MSAPKFLRTATCLVLAVAAVASAQEPTTTIPDSYKVQFENEFVRVVHVHYDAGATLPPHSHGAGTTVYVYLNDSDSVVFRHSGSVVINRPPVKTGAMRVSDGQEEVHSVENTAQTPSDFLRLSIKTEAGGASVVQRLAPEDGSFSSPQLRITRLRIEQHDTATIDATRPALLIELPSGNTRWISAGTSETIHNHEVPELAMVRIDFLTKPKPAALQP